MSLRDEMLKAGLISEEQARRAAHETRKEKKRSDPKERQQRQEAKRREVEQQREAERARHREQARQQGEQRAVREQDAQSRQKRATALEAAYRDGQLAKWEGQRRYYYAANGRVEWLMVSDDVARKLESGQAAIVAGERNPARHTLVNAPAARTLREVEPERVHTWHTA